MDSDDSNGDLRPNARTLSKWYTDIVGRALANAVPAHIVYSTPVTHRRVVRPRPPFPGPGGTDPDLPPSDQYPAWVRDAPGALDSQDAAARARIGALPIRTEPLSDPDSYRVAPKWLNPSWITGGFTPTTGTTVTAGYAPLVGSGGSSSHGQITLFTGSIPPPGQPYPYGHQHPHTHPATVQTPIQEHHSHFHRHDGRINDHSDYNLDQHSHSH